MIKTDTYFPLFVYGTLMSGQPAFHLIARAIERSAPAKVHGFTLHNVGHYPIAVAGKGQIMGEVHWLNPTGYDTLLNELELYEGSEYQRVQVTAQLDVDLQSVHVWLFAGDPGFGTRFPQIPAGDWRTWLQRGRNRC